ncbi:DUF6323 family protein [Brevibacillus borstelensis]|uniref:DUF6323 family protein n=1 Tax=Brevibacillus borstelensis TaxID=45462 RepID=UPI0030C2C5CF
MILSRIFKSVSVAAQEQRTILELLELNEKTKASGLMLAPEEINCMMTARNQLLQNCGRLELGIEVTKELIEVFSASPYISQDHYASTLIELHEIFYYAKNETEDRIGDFKLIGIMKDHFDNECGGSLELLRSKLEEFAVTFRIEAMRNGFEGDDD